MYTFLCILVGTTGCGALHNFNRGRDKVALVNLFIFSAAVTYICLI